MLFINIIVSAHNCKASTTSRSHTYFYVKVIACSDKATENQLILQFLSAL